jgi:diacylglycerol kinase (ATP)
LLKLLKKAGHKVDYQSSKDKKWHKALKDPGDVVAVAGGDGTVGKVARRMIGSSTPIAILPIGTANNVANTLGTAGWKIKDLVASWKGARAVHFDAGVAKGPWGTRHFIEGFGLGLFAELMFQLNVSKKKKLEPADDPAEELRAVLELLHSQLGKLDPKPITVRLDGKDLSGQYVLLEALNVRFVGPNLNLAPEADTQDGLLDLVAIPFQKRSELAKYLKGWTRESAPMSKSRRHRGRLLQIEWDGSPVHLDDSAWPSGDKPDLQVKSHSITIQMEPGAVVFMIPDKARRSRPRANSGNSK